MKKESHLRRSKSHYHSLLATLPKRIRIDAESIVKVFFIRKSPRLRLTDNYLIKLWECSRATVQRRLKQLEEFGVIRRHTKPPQKKDGGFVQYRLLFLVPQKKSLSNQVPKVLVNNLASGQIKRTPSMSFEDYLSLRMDVPKNSFLFWMRKWDADPRSMGYVAKTWEKVKKRADVLESILFDANAENLKDRQRVGFIIREIHQRVGS
jgi:DNA-binding Lrp family transcriptional regulator